VKGETTDAPAPPLSPAGELVRRHDRDRFMTALFAPAARREDLFALYAFNYEIARVRETVSEPMLGRIRLQWWRECIEAAYQGGPVRRHVVAEAVTAAIRSRGLSRGPFDRLIDTRERDLDESPFPTLGSLRDYAAGTSAALIELAVEALAAGSGTANEAAREVGVGYALAGLLRAVPFHARLGRCYIPADIAAHAGLDLRDYAAARASAPLRAAVAEIAAAASDCLRRARDLRARVPRAAVPALLPAIIAARALDRLRRARYDPFDPALATGDPLQSWRLAAAALLGRF